MKAIVYHNSGSGDVLKLEEIEKPVPRDDEVLIKVRAASVNQVIANCQLPIADWRVTDRLIGTRKISQCQQSPAIARWY